MNRVEAYNAMVLGSVVKIKDVKPGVTKEAFSFFLGSTLSTASYYKMDSEGYVIASPDKDFLDPYVIKCKGWDPIFIGDEFIWEIVR